MMGKDLKRLVFFGVPLLVLLYTLVSLYKGSFTEEKSTPGWISDVSGPGQAVGTVVSRRKGHTEVFSVSTPDRKFFHIDFGGPEGMNPNIIPHPSLDDTYIVVAQEVGSEPALFSELYCLATFHNGALRCLLPAARLPIAATSSDKCLGDLAFFNLNVGPHDARLLYGPGKPYIMYGSQSAFTCFGLWIHDFRELVADWAEKPGIADFQTPRELQRPGEYGVVEKNWFPFWDAYGFMYVHYDVYPRRVFARLNPDGSVGEDLAPLAAGPDERCLQRYMPVLPPTLESIHQATNSLKITLCSSVDEGCVAGDDNTFIMTIWQHKTFYHFHGVYEPYVMLFHHRSPFAVHAVSRLPVWIHGRERYPDRNTSDMLYVTSMNWKKRGVNYHGYLDDELFLAFGIEDARSGGIDLRASELLANLGLCQEL